MRCLSLCVFASLQIVRSGIIKRDPCTLNETNSTDVCVPIENCIEVLVADLGKQTIFPETCDLVCCPTTLVCCPTAQQKSQNKVHERISARKCKEYSSPVFRNNMGHSLILNHEIKLKDKCRPNSVPPIRGDRLAVVKEFPSVALIGYENSYGENDWLCGGALISEQHILTTAKCLNSPLGTPTTVGLGFTDNLELNVQNVYKVVENTKHPDYQNESLINNLGILKLEKAVKMSAEVRPACLYTDSDTLVLCSSWKKSGNQTWLYKEFVHPCNNDEENNQSNDMYIGFSFPPSYDHHEVPGKILLRENENFYCNQDLVGISSERRSLDLHGRIKFTKISSYVEWIEKVVWPEP